MAKSKSTTDTDMPEPNAIHVEQMEGFVPPSVESSHSLSVWDLLAAQENEQTAPVAAPSHTKGE